MVDEIRTNVDIYTRKRQQLEQAGIIPIDIEPIHASKAKEGLENLLRIEKEYIEMTKIEVVAKKVYKTKLTREERAKRISEGMRRKNAEKRAKNQSFIENETLLTNIAKNKLPVIEVQPTIVQEPIDQSIPCIEEWDAALRIGGIVFHEDYLKVTYVLAKAVFLGGPNVGLRDILKVIKEQ